MNQMLFMLCLMMFLLIPPGLFAIKFIKRSPAWWIVLGLIILLGWASILATIIFYYAHIGDLVAQGIEDPQAWDSDGAKLVFGLFFGWLFSLIYALPWMIIYCIAANIRRWREKPSGV